MTSFAVIATTIASNSYKQTNGSSRFTEIFNNAAAQTSTSRFDQVDMDPPDGLRRVPV